ncbi:hypothetical protein PRIPAC_84672 [Pristionchus pacificus]|uniref:Uncharacterized protein n=1 Tax=Pristionchus pacificus TaxID=54126 RepID=A0A2A6BM69_PRIPA|nr:hypothetical protein PRIPAC_84672 [Pristionchus pacificus]|eukprot:PDM66938.1 hypothetical protein PRIPAC_48355 [Pristionchus pacificus]
MCIFSQISILSRDLLAVYEFRESFFGSTEIIGIVSTMPSELYKWAHKGQTSDKQECLFILLERAINWPKTMEKLLECGFLSVAHHYAHLPINQTTVREANVYASSSILLMHPEYRQVFRRWTCDGVMGNATADFGRSIPPSRTGVGRNYVLVDEDTEMF